jgi:hypothetical protein
VSQDGVTSLGEFSPVDDNILRTFFFENYRSSANVWAALLDSASYVCINFDKNMGWAT